jgi:uncharacterized repeat protein (TIGR01451 family)
MRFRVLEVATRASLRTLIGVGIAITAIRVVPSVTASSWATQGIPLCDLSYFGQNLILICTYEGYFKATNVGWQKLFPPGWGEVKATLDGTIYFYRFETHQVYRSTDGGETWVLMGKVPAADFDEHIFPSPVPDMIFLGVLDTPFIPDVRGVYRSADGGATWRKVLGGGNGVCVAFSPDFARDGIAFAALTEYHASLGIWKTEDWGETWFPVNDGLYVGEGYWGHQWVAVSPQFPQDQTVFTSDWAGLYKTTNGGESWVEIDDQAALGPMVFSPNYINDQTLLLGRQTLGLDISQDGGQTWRVIHDKESSAVGIRRSGPFGPPSALLPPLGPHRLYLPLVSNNFAINGPGALEFWVVSQEEYFGDSYLYRSLDYGTTWEEVSVYSQLTVTKHADPALVQGGESLTYTLRVTNAGSVILHAIITDTLPAHVVSGTTAGGSAILPGGTLTWQPVITPANMGVSSGVWTEMVVVTVEADYVGPLTNVAQATTVEGATGVHSETIAVVEPQVYLPVVLRHHC